MANTVARGFAFCAAAPVSSSRVGVKRPRAPFQIPKCAAHPPKRIANVTKDLREALQESLKARTSRIDIQLPVGSKLGTEKRQDEETPSARRQAGDRELARIVCAMFENTGLKVATVFPTDSERKSAAAVWGSTNTSQLISWRAGAGQKTAKQKQKGKPSGGFGGSPSTSNQSDDDTDVYVLVGGGAAFLSRARTLAQSIGMDKLIILLNGNSSQDQLPLDIVRFISEEFEPVYHYRPNPHPKWSGGVLFRKFPDELIKSEEKPALEELAVALTAEEKNAADDLLKKITGFMS